MEAEEILTFHDEFVQNYFFDVPIHYKNLAMLLHPNWGYMCKFLNKKFSFEELLEIYHIEIVSSFFRQNGRVR